MAQNDARFIVGIDLGTTNTVVAAVDTAAPGQRGDRPAVELFEVEQLVAVGEVARRPMLPSVRYHAAPGELPAEQVRLPWPALDEEHEPIVGELANVLGARVPGRLVTSAKSWLCHPDVDRTAAILPWGAGEDVPKVSPVEASASFLAHVRAAWDARHPDAPLAQQDVVLTVPASFDDDARQLTVRAAQRAGLSRLRLIEEPTAAMYDWLWRHQNELAGRLEGVRLALVCDVGGGTSDFSLIRVELRESGPRLTRTAVGDHLMLGGDNMDLALARLSETRLGAGQLGSRELGQLIQQCRVAKERLLQEAPPESARVALLGGGSRVVGGTRAAELARDEVRTAILDGFFPAVALDAAPARRQAAIREFGLPYVADPAVTRHLAAFLTRHEEAAREALGSPETGDGSRDPSPVFGLVPDAVLLNGGVFRAAALRQRTADVLAAWRGQALRELDNPDPDLAVARGAAAYGLARRGVGLRIGGGSARSYFLLVEGRRKGSREAVCLVPRGVEEGEEIALADRAFSLRLGRPVTFHLASTSTSRYHRAGELVPFDEAALTELPPLAVVLEGAGGASAPSDDRQLPVTLAAQLTEVGTLELHCVAAGDPGRRWALEFQVRGETASARAPKHAAVVTELHPRLPAAKELVQHVYSRARAGAEGPREVKNLRRELESVLGARETWTTPLLRELFGLLLAGAKRRRRSADHERVWFNLAGWCLRPGYGYPLDEWRIENVRALHAEGVQYGKEARIWSEWWTFWRRVAGGLDEALQTALFEEVEPRLGSAVSKKGREASGIASTADEMLRLAAALENVAPAKKVALGKRLLERLDERSEKAPLLAWAIGRLGARAPLHGSAHAVIARGAAETWLERLLGLDWRRVDGASFAAVLVARRTGDRERDVADALRVRVIERIESGAFPAHWVSLVRDVTELALSEQRLAFGEAMPPGLRLID